MKFSDSDLRLLDRHYIKIRFFGKTIYIWNTSPSLVLKHLYEARSGGSLLVVALEKIIEMNRQNALDQYGDADKAEGWSCVSVSREALLSFSRR